MIGRTLSIFVDESGRFQYPDERSRFYIIGMVFHDQAQDISDFVRDLELTEEQIGLEDHCFHAGPLIRKEKGYEFLSRSFRGKILSRMMAFAQRVNFKYHCLDVDKRFVDSTDGIVNRLRSQLSAFIADQGPALLDVERVKVYYDCGQSPVTNLLHKTFEDLLKQKVEFAQGVRPARYRLFQLADLVCTLHLIELRLKVGERMTESEMRFFGGPRDFKRNFLKKIKDKEI